MSIMKHSMSLVLAAMFCISLTYAQPIIKIWGNEDSLLLKKVTLQYLEHLNIYEQVHLSVAFTAHMPEKLQGITLCLTSSASHTFKVIKVKIDAGLSKKQQMLVLAHEMIHVRQYVKGELMVTDGQVIWKGRKYYYQNATCQRVPWENEAYQMDNLLAKLYKATEGTPLTAWNNEP